MIQKTKSKWDKWAKIGEKYDQYISSWFQFCQWRYLLEGCSGWHNFWCRFNNHPHGTVFYNPNGLEPNNHCIDCGEDLY